MNFVIGLLSVCFRPKADIARSKKIYNRVPEKNYYYLTLDKVTDMITQFGNQVDLQLMKRLAQHVSGFEFEEALELLVEVRAMPVN